MTVEIEHVNTDILEELVAEGKVVYPKPSTIRLIQVKFCWYISHNKVNSVEFVSKSHVSSVVYRR